MPWLAYAKPQAAVLALPPVASKIQPNRVVGEIMPAPKPGVECSANVMPRCSSLAAAIVPAVSADESAITSMLYKPSRATTMSQGSGGR